MKSARSAGAIALVVLLLPVVIPGSYVYGVSVLVGVYALAALGVDVLFGFAGLLSLGQAAFMGIGGYATALLTTRLGWSSLAAATAGAALAALVALAVGRAVLRLRGYYFVIATMAGGLVFEHVMVGWIDFTGGPSGLTGVPPLAVAGFTVGSDVQYHYVVWALILIALVGLQNLTAGHVGRVLRALAADEESAAVLGVDVAAFKLRAFVASGVLGSLAGSVLAHYMRFISPEMVGLHTSLSIATMLCLGGAGTLWGAVLGVAVLKILPELIGWMRDYQLVIHGLLLMAVMIAMPEGLAGIFRWAAWSRREARSHGRLAASPRAQ